MHRGFPGKNKQRALFVVAFVCVQALLSPPASAVDFSRDVLPILSDRCFQCHGPDESHVEADLRLDLRESATEDRGGYRVVDTESPAASELLIRVLDEDASYRMPPPEAHRKPLDADEVDVLRRWIEGGAKWGRHWAFEPPVRPDPPETDGNPIDGFVLRRLKESGLQLAEQAEPHTQLRRVSFDLTGLPPSLQALEGFVADPSPETYAAQVDRLLASPHYGERMAVWWLDAARYSDTDGFQKDETRTNWPWRDWVIDAFNRGMPFDRFTIEQFAGDLLPDATDEQVLATCFHRNHMTNGEGGRDPEESRVDYVIDRINTVGTVWMGLTLGCSQCHSHKFDPITQADYYSLTAFFNSIDEDGQAGLAAKPYLSYRSDRVARAVAETEAVVNRRRTEEAAAREAALGGFETWFSEQAGRAFAGFQPWRVLREMRLETAQGTVLTEEPEGYVQASGPNPRQDDYRVFATTDLDQVTGLRLEVLPHESHTEGKLSRGESGEFILTDVKLQVRAGGGAQLSEIKLAHAVSDVEKPAKRKQYGLIIDTLDDDPRNGWTTDTFDPLVPHVAVFALAEPLAIDQGQELVFEMLHRSTVGDANVGRFRLSVTDQAGPAVRSLEPMPLEQLAASGATSLAELEPGLRERLTEQFLSTHSAYQEARQRLASAERQLEGIRQAAGELQVMVLAEREEPRDTFVLERGLWDSHGKQVPTAFPEAVLAWPAERSRTRLDFAEWLVARENPLTARVIVNQLWQLCFGAGLVRTPEDFGLQGERPTHPELLDWLAVELIESGWDVKHLLKLIVTSETYRQSSAVTAELLERDPENRLLARGARFRLPSWMIRDAALSSSGLLNQAAGGPPVMPYQPPGVWEELFMGRFQYEPSQGPAQHRRSLYAFWRRAAGLTFLFDSAQRRVCEVRNRRTNTPLHALTLLNDLSQLESARELARWVLEQPGGDADRIALLYRRVLSRPASESESAVLMRQIQRARTHYRSEPADATAFLDFGQPELRHADEPAELAAYTQAASMLYNLDEAITHE